MGEVWGENGERCEPWCRTFLGYDSAELKGQELPQRIKAEPTAP